MTTHLELIQNFVDDLLQEDQELFCVEIKIKPTNNIKIFLDGDNGIIIQKCVQINRKLYKYIEEQNFFEEGDFSLEVSSPGVDEPLKLIRQYKKNIGRDVDIILSDDTVKSGILLEVSENNIIIEKLEGKGKKAVKINEEIDFLSIKKATIQINFKSK